VVRCNFPPAALSIRKQPGIPVPFKTLLISMLLFASTSQSVLTDNHLPVDATAIKFVELIIMPPELMGDPLREISENWDEGYIPMLI
jgi:hypothetical protein